MHRKLIREGGRLSEQARVRRHCGVLYSKLVAAESFSTPLALLREYE